MKTEFYIYEWYIVNTGEVFYIGKGKKDRYKRIKGRNKFFTDMYNSHNCNVRKIYENLTETEAFELEIKVIKYYRENTNFRLTNQTDGGEGLTGWKPNNDFKNKQSEIHKLQWQDENFRNKMMSIRQDKKGVYKSQEFRDKISELVKGNKNPNYNNSWSDEQKENLRQKQKQNDMYKNETNPNAKPIICVETGETFSCIKYAKEKYHVASDGSFTVALKTPYKTAGKRHWVFADSNTKEICYNSQKRFEYLISILNQCVNYKPIVCIETKEIFNSISELAKELEISTTKIKWYINKNKVFVYQDKSYILLNEYSRIT